MSELFCPFCTYGARLIRSRGTAFYRCPRCDKKAVIVELPPSPCAVVTCDAIGKLHLTRAELQTVIDDLPDLGKELP